MQVSVSSELLSPDSPALQIRHKRSPNKIETTVKELLVTSENGERWTIDIAHYEEPETVVKRVRDFGITCRDHRFIPPSQIKQIDIRTRTFKTP